MTSIKTKRSVLSLFNFSLFAVIQRLISWMDSSVRDQDRSGSALSDISGYHRRRMYVCMYFQYDLEIWLVVSRKCAQNILHLRKFPSNNPFPGLYVKFRMRHQLLVGFIFKILCQYRKIMSVGPFSRIWVVSLGRGGRCIHPSHPLCIRACFSVLMFETSKPLFENKYRNKLSVEIKLSCAKSP